MQQPGADAAHAIVLAAGAGRRFGGKKLVSDFRGRPLIHWSVETALAIQVETVTVVLGAEPDLVREALSGLTDPRLVFVHCTGWADGLSASLARGISSLPDDASAALIFLGDMPEVNREVADRVLTAVLQGAPAAMPVYSGQPAHPVGVSSTLFPDLQSLTGDKGARNMLRHVDGVVEIETEDPGSVFDIDTPRDLRSGVRS